MSLDAFRAATRGWLAANAPEALLGTRTSPFAGYWGGVGAAFESPAHQAWFDLMLGRGWTAPTWPTAYGGGGLGPEEGRVLEEELARLGLPPPLVGFGLTMIGPILLQFGNEAQRREHVPRIVRGEVRWCQGYSEPNAGSDLAALECQAVIGGDELVVTGQKVWTSHAEKADWIFCLVRTRAATREVRKQAGITFVIFPMTAPGVSVRPITLISGASPFCETFLDGVRVPLANVVGELHGGWAVANGLLRHERSMVGAAIAGGGARPESLQAYSVREHAVDVVGLADGRLADPVLRARVARHELDDAVMELTLRRLNDGLEAGQSPGNESSILKVAGTWLNQERWGLAMEIEGPDALLWDGEPDRARSSSLARHWLRTRGNSIEGGTSEIQLNIVARRVLGLPRG